MESSALSIFIEELKNLEKLNFPEDKILDLFRNTPPLLEYLKPYVFFTDKKYTRNLVYGSKSFELIAMCWSAGQHSPIHGHENQKCFLRVEQGALTFDNYDDKIGGDSSELLKKISTQAGEKGFVDGPAYIHKVSNASDHNAVSLHLYARPFHQCDIYDLDHHEVKKVSLGFYSVEGSQSD